MTQLLVSVRSLPEAHAAKAGGAGIIDIKEPLHGSLGRAADHVIREVLNKAGKQVPISAAMGELHDFAGFFAYPGLAYAKWGLAGYESNSSWRVHLSNAAASLTNAVPGCRPVAVAYADWETAHSPLPGDVISFVEFSGWDTLLLDTHTKDGRSLLDWLTVDQVIKFCRRCRASGIKVALAGSLGASEIERLGEASPDWFAVRTAACADGNRNGVISAEKVGELVKRLIDQSTVTILRN